MKKSISDILWELIPHENKYVITEKDILDYITNLQQENEDLKDKLDIFILSNKTKQETIDKFRKRIEKAVEKLEEYDRQYIVVHEGYSDCFILKVIDILNGRSDE